MILKDFSNLNKSMILCMDKSEFLGFCQSLGFSFYGNEPPPVQFNAHSAFQPLLHSHPCLGIPLDVQQNPLEPSRFPLHVAGCQSDIPPGFGITCREICISLGLFLLGFSNPEFLNPFPSKSWFRYRLSLSNNSMVETLRLYPEVKFQKLLS